MFGQLATSEFWEEALEASLRQAFQVLLPFLAVVGATGQLDGDGAVASGIAAGVAAAVVILRRLAGLTQGGLVGRAVSAAAASLLAVVAAESFDVLTVDWRATAIAAVTSALTAVIHGFLDPPATLVAKEFAGRGASAFSARVDGDD